MKKTLHHYIKFESFKFQTLSTYLCQVNLIHGQSGLNVTQIAQIRRQKE